MPSCKYLHNHACLTVRGTWKPCCIFQWQHIGLKTTSLEEYRASDQFKEIITTMESDRWHPGCRQCEVDESIGKKSLRSYANQVSSGIPDRIESMEIALSNTCNLTCKMCGPHASNKWQEIYEADPKIRGWQFPYQPTNNHSVSSVFDGIDLTALRTIKYLGGEPFITKEVGELFETLDNQGVVERMEFACNTNATVFPKKHLGMLERFGALNIGVSVDGVGDLANYIRTGFSWDRLLPVINQWAEFANWRRARYGSPGVYIATTVQAYNIHQMPMLFELASRLNLKLVYHFLYTPRALVFEALPSRYVAKILESISDDPMVPAPIINKLRSTSNDPELTKQLVKITNDMDSAMGTSLAEVIPDLWLALRDTDA